MQVTGFIFVIATTILIVTIIVTFFTIFLIMPDTIKEKEKRKWSDIRDSITTNKVKLSLIMLILVGLFFLLISFCQSNSWQDFVDGIFIELFGIFFDVIFLVLLFNWLNSIGERKNRVNRYKEELDDYRYWKSDQSKFRIRGIIKRLNKEAVTKVDLNFIDLSGDCQEDDKVKFVNVNLDGSFLNHTNLSFLQMNESNFSGTNGLHYTKFIRTDLLKAKFMDCHLQGVDFSEAYLHSADFNGSTLIENTNFKDADIRHAKFINVKFGKVIFDNAIVTADFFDLVEEWDIKGTNVFSDYIVDRFAIGRSYRYFLRKK